jgi:hypothetical protein
MDWTTELYVKRLREAQLPHGYTDFPQNVDAYCVYRCNRCVAIVARGDVASHDTFHDQYLSRQELGTLSSAAWCDKGNHAFKAGEDGSESGTMTVNRNGQKVTVQRDVCAEHATFSAPAALEAAPEYGSPS